MLARLTVRVTPRQFMQNSATANPIQTCGVLSWDQQHLGSEV